MAKIEGLTALLAQLRRKAAEAQKGNASVVVGYTQNYAIYVHEDLDAVHPVGQAKFLEQPARTLSGDGTLGGIILTVMRKGKTLATGLLLAALRIQRESQKLCPIDTGALKASAFTRLERGEAETGAEGGAA